MRGRRHKGNRYFGPYTHAYAIRETLDLLLRTFPIRTCSDNKLAVHQKQGRPCLLFHIEKCAGPCVGEVQPEEYAELVESLLQFLGGDTDAVVEDLETKMRGAAERLEFETAARLRAAGWVFDAGVFRTESEDYIDHVFCAPMDGCLSARDKIYVNIGESNAQGLELYTARAEGDLRWRPYASLTWMKRENRYENFVTEDSGTPSLSGTLGLTWEPLFATAMDGWLDLGLRGESASKREEPSSAGLSTLDEDDAWLTLNLSGGLQFGAARRLGLVVRDAAHLSAPPLRPG